MRHVPANSLKKHAYLRELTLENVFLLRTTAYITQLNSLLFAAFGDINEQEFDDAVIDQRKRTMGEEFEEDLRSAFAVIDKDEDGFINSDDIYQLMMGIGEMLSDDELMDIVKAADYDKDGQLNYRGTTSNYNAYC